LAAEEEQPEVKRPIITGAHNWRYNNFSSYDQLRINFEREFGRAQKFFGSIHGLYYQEEDNKSWDVYVGESYYKFKAKKFDFKLGLLIETLGSGDKISFVDKINSRRYHSGLANDYNRDKREQPAIKTTYYINRRMNIEVHYLPIFEASELPGIYSRWASEFQKYLAAQISLGVPYYHEETRELREQYHVAFNSAFKKYELRYHYFRLKERFPVVEQIKNGYFSQYYPLDETWALDGNYTLSSEFLLRFELAFTRDKTYSSFTDKRIGYHFRSDQYNMLLGTDRRLKNNVYINVQIAGSYIADMKAPTPFQVYDLETMGTLQVRKGFRNETLFIEFNGITNFTTGEFILTPQMILQRGDFLKFVGGMHFNGKSTESLGPVGQFDKNNTPYIETQIIF